MAEELICLERSWKYLIMAPSLLGVWPSKSLNVLPIVQESFAGLGRTVSSWD